MKSICLLVFLTYNFCQAKVRTDVVVKGTTMRPNFKRVEGENSLRCPKEYPWSFFNGTRCCSSFHKSGQDSLQYKDLECSMEWIPCPAKLPRKCVSFAKPVICPSSHPVSMGFGCCPSDLASFDGDKCLAQKLEPYITPLECCPGYLPIPSCEIKRQRCVTDYAANITKPPKQILEQSENWGEPNYLAENVFEDEECERTRDGYWLPLASGSPAFGGYFILDLGRHAPIHKFVVRNTDHIGNSKCHEEMLIYSGTESFEIKVSNFSDTAWMSVVNGTLEDPASFSDCTVPLVTFSLAQSVICRFVHFSVVKFFRTAAAIRYVGIE